MTDPTPWLVVEQSPAPGCPPGIYRNRCLRCGDTNDIIPPMPVDDFVRRMSEFGARHRKCKDADEVKP